MKIIELTVLGDCVNAEYIERISNTGEIIEIRTPMSVISVDFSGCETESICPSFICMEYYGALLDAIGSERRVVSFFELEEMVKNSYKREIGDLLEEVIVKVRQREHQIYVENY